MLDSQVVAFLGVSVLVIVTPGADMALLTKVVLSNGQRAALLALAGIMTGHVAWVTLSVAGLAALLNASATAFTGLKLAGGAYLAYLGLQAIWQSRRHPGTPATVLPAPMRMTDTRAFRQGLLSNLLNPKVGVFYTIFLPQFVTADDPVIAKSALFALIFIVMGMGWLAWYITAVGKMAGLLSRSRVRAWLDRATGAVLIALGLRLAFERS